VVAVLTVPHVICGECRAPAGGDSCDTFHLQAGSGGHLLAVCTRCGAPMVGEA